MAITVKHNKVSAIPDSGDNNLVEPSDWNADHVLTGTIPVDNGGTGASTLTGYVKGNGTSTMTATTTIPSTDVTGLGTMSTQNANSVAITGGTISGVSITGYIPTTEKAVANGVATLDGSGTVPVSQLPAAVLGALSYQGTWNASTNTPTLTSSVGTKGYYYVVNVAGSTNLNGITDWQIGDWAVYNGSAWQKIDNTDAVTSVNGYTGTVVLTQTDISGTVPTSRTITAGTGLTGGGDLTANRTLAIDSTVATLTGIQTLTNKSISGSTNTLSNIANASLTNSSITINGSAIALGGTVSVGTVTSVTGTSPVVSSGGTTPAISMPVATTSVSGYLSSTDWTTFNNKSNTNGTVTSVAALTLGTTGTDLSSTVATGTTTPVITLQVPTASATNRGALSSTDWTTFNNKGSGTVTSITSSTLTVAGTSAIPTINLTSGIATAGTTGSATLIPVVTIDTYGRVTTITTAANPQGTVTSVSGTGTVNGLTLTGTVTSSGSLTLGGTLDLSSPPAIGGTTANLITGTTITGTKFVGISGGTF